MQPMINPNYFNQYQYQPSYQQQGTRLVNNFNEIQVNEIPMDGTYRLFAKADMSEIQARAWDSNGTIKVLEYSLKNAPIIPNMNNVAQEEQKDPYEPILTEIRTLSEKIDKLSKGNRRKEVQDNESAT